MPPPFMMPPAGFIPGRAAFFCIPACVPGRASHPPGLPGSATTAGLLHCAGSRAGSGRRRCAPCRAAACPIRIVRWAGVVLKLNASLPPFRMVSVFCLAMPANPHNPLSHIPCCRFAVLQPAVPFANGSERLECKWQKHSGACRALIFIAAFACRGFLLAAFAAAARAMSKRACFPLI